MRSFVYYIICILCLFIFVSLTNIYECMMLNLNLKSTLLYFFVNTICIIILFTLGYYLINKHIKKKNMNSEIITEQIIGTLLIITSIYIYIYTYSEIS